MPREYYIYMLANKHLNVLYTGVTNNLFSWVEQHKNKMTKGFTKKYNVDRLVYFELYDDIGYAIAREKQIKKWSRAKKNALVKTTNPTWKDLYEELCSTM